MPPRRQSTKIASRVFASLIEHIRNVEEELDLHGRRPDDQMANFANGWNDVVIDVASRVFAPLIEHIRNVEEELDLSRRRPDDQMANFAKGRRPARCGHNRLRLGCLHP